MDTLALISSILEHSTPNLACSLLADNPQLVPFIPPVAGALLARGEGDDLAKAQALYEVLITLPQPRIRPTPPGLLVALKSELDRAVLTEALDGRGEERKARRKM